MCVCAKIHIFSDYGTGCVRILGPGCSMWLIMEPGRILSRPTDDI